MIRVVLFFLAVAVLALGVTWLADRPGEVIVLWQGLRIETSVMVMAAALCVAAIGVVVLWSLLRTVLRAPDLLSMFLRNRRGAKAYRAVSQGLIAVGTGDARAARKFAQEARRLAPGEPLALLLSAQTAQLSGDRGGAEQAFAEMARRPDTKLLGLRGLFVEAQRRGDRTAAHAYAEEAVKVTPSPGWSGQAVLEFRCAAGDWAGALAMLERNVKARLVDRATYKRERAVLLTAQALAAEETDPDTARTLALEAVKLAPTLVPAAALAGRLLAEAGELRQAGRVIEKAWRANPHPDLAETYAHLRFGDSARDRLTRIKLLTQKPPGHMEGALALARAALDAREFAIARAALAPLLTQPTQRVALLMAEIEEIEHGDEGRSREWMSRALHAARDPAWTADGLISDRWLPVSPVSGRLDAFQWKVPLAELASPRVLNEEAAERAAVVDARPAEKIAATERAPMSTPASQDDAAPALETSSQGAAQPAQKPPRVEAIIPLVRVPDDPGPETEAEPEATSSGSVGWGKFLK
jgi:HemY protein